jgi:hypothetical protein
MHALKGLVIGLGILVVVSFALLLYGFYAKLSNHGSQLFGNPDRPKGSQAIPFGTVSIPLPAACSIVEMRPLGNRLYLRTGPAGACDRILIIDVDSGRQIGTLLIDK